VYPQGDATTIKASVLAIDARVDPTTRNAAVRAQLPASDARVHPGSSVRVRVSVGDPRVAVAVPASAVRKGPEGDHVFVLIADDTGALRARTRQVRIETLSGDDAIIESGLSVGEKVAASGSFKLRDAALVSVMDEPQAVAFANEATR
jgi:membrane fusion protein (multidrug efflux system)